MGPGASRQASDGQAPKPEPLHAKSFWRTLDERLGDPAFQQHLHNEFPSLLPTIEQVSDPVARRAFLKLMGASLALAGVSACTRQPAERIVPYVRQPEELVPGRPLFYATAMTLGGVATGLLVESHEGRPTKVEGNPLHPGSVGASDIYAQAAILGLYDPDRSETLTNLGEIRPWSAFLGAINGALTAQRPLRGAGVRLLTESIGSPTLATQIRDVLTRFPDARWHQWDPASRNNVRLGSKLAFGEFVDAQYRLDQADVILSLDADFLASGPGSLRYARDFAARRRPEQADRMSRLYAVESMPTSTGARADHRLPLRPSAIENAARQIAGALGVGRSVGGSATGAGGEDRAARFIAAVVKDLQAHRGRSLVVAGDGQSPAVHALAHAINQTLGNVGSTVVYTQAIEAEPVDQVQSLRDLVADMNAGKVDLLVIVGGNPVYTAPADLEFADALGKVRLRAHLSQHVDETSALCHWHIPEAHFLEAWSDARGYDGTVSIVQPLIAPLYGGRSAHDVLAAMSERPEHGAHDLIREFWKVDKDDRTWRKWLHDGVVPDSAFAPKTVTVQQAAIQPSASNQQSATSNQQLLEISFRNDPSILDGRFANNGWLQELPKPITRLTWDNAVLVSPATGAKLRQVETPAFRGGEHGQIVTNVVELRYRGRSIRGPLFEVAGHPDDCATVHLGYGRARGGKLAAGAGFNAYQIRTADALDFSGGLEIVSSGERYSLACTQYHHLMEGRGMVKALSRDEFTKNPRAVHEGEETPAQTFTLYPNYEYQGYKWGMAIDVNACIGCNACVVGCQAENNIAVIGKDQVLRGREMHWIRIDTYYRGEQANPETYFQPVPCMQCENAPCEVVCPVGATVHSHEGLNDMVYNRCVGTRYCSNNCPYKVRRFNFLLYQDWNTPSLKLARNPDVTVRSRGVMEKCTYCVQRINEAKIDSEKEGRAVRDGDIQTACQQACPANAIVFGNLNDPASRVAQLKAEERNYAMLGELNTRPRTTYLAAIRNPNPELEG
ncbi:MAG TPA: TAT-variant-translocated molybdopterin oxidoreductase [Vicinamibacterales bacterium]|nr:TAT-variant-translocated molybdopterin oxidoreductase [Vicinamibacterales bacterium]